MVNHIFLTIAIVIGVLTLIPAGVQSAPIDPEVIWSLISEGKCSDARQAVQQSAEAGQFLAAPEGKILYAKSLCCSPPEEVSETDISNAVSYLKSAREALNPVSASTALWIDDALRQCEETRLSLADNNTLGTDEMLAAKKNSIIITSSYQGKVMAGCKEPNLSPMLVPANASENGLDWHYVTVRPGQGSAELRPSEKYLQALVKKYVGGTPRVSVCAPYIALSDSQDPAAICKDVMKFTDHFVSQYDAKRTPTWISIYHYPQQSDRIYEHARNTTGDIQCSGVLGYYDWRRQSVVFGAPPGYFGTFHHELSHAFLFWDIPLAPRWFEESIAALYENTDGEYRSIANTWRDRLLERNNIDTMNTGVLRDRVLQISLLEFEHSPVPATIAREYMRSLQRCGDLPGLYKAVREHYRHRDSLAEAHREPHESPSKATVDMWLQIIDQFDRVDNPPAGCS